MLAELLQDHHAGQPASHIAARFHRWVAASFAAAAQRTSQASGLTTVCLSGGCMHNRLLTRLLVEELERFGLRPLLHRQVSPGDGGISYGQAAIAAARLTAI